jgi:iron-sulfur cluster assembly accessory protein
MITLTPEAISKVKEIMSQQTTPTPAALRVGVSGGGCSGFQYRLEFVSQEEIQPDWNVLELGGLKVVVDQMSAMYLEGTEIDFINTLPESGFKFRNPKVKSTCGCGASFNA